MPHSPVIDLRSDTVTKPTPRCGAPWPRPKSATTSTAKTRPSTGCEERAAEIFGREAALFVPSGIHGQPDLPSAAHAARPGSHLRGARHTSSTTKWRRWPRSPACLPRRVRAEDGILDVERDRRGHPSEGVLPRADVARVAREHAQHGRRHGLTDGNRARRSATKPTTQDFACTSTGRASSTPRPRSANRWRR